MNKKLVLVTLIMAINLYRCSSPVQMLPEPVDNKNLLIGSLIFDIDGYEDNFTTIRQHIEVAIVGRYLKDGNIQNFGQWATTDENGYFFIANVQDGEYAIKGFRTHLIGLGNLIIENQLLDRERNYFELKNTDVISMTGNLFDVRSNQRIVNFAHNYFKLYRGGIIDFQRYNRVENLKLSMGDVLNSPTVPTYFIERFEGSGWESYLNLQLK